MHHKRVNQPVMAHEQSKPRKRLSAAWWVSLFGAIILVTAAPMAQASSDTNGLAAPTNVIVWIVGGSTFLNISTEVCAAGAAAGNNGCAPIQPGSGSPTTPRVDIWMRNITGTKPGLWQTGSTLAMSACGLDSTAAGTSISRFCYNYTVPAGAWVAASGTISVDWRTVTINHDYYVSTWQTSGFEFRYGSLYDIGAVFESQSHANSTWCPLTCDNTGSSKFVSWFNNTYQPGANQTWFEGQVHANNTWEGQAHANSTWCALATGCNQFPAWFNSTYQPGANQTWFEGQVHANSTWCSIGACSASGSAAFQGWFNSYANNTWEGQQHANNTWCPLVNVAGCKGNFNGNFTGNFSIDNKLNITNLSSMTGSFNMIPTDIATSGFFLVLMCLGVAISFASKTNPVPTLVGMVVQIFSGILLIAASSEVTFPTTFYLPLLVVFVGCIALSIARLISISYGKAMTTDGSAMSD